MMLQQSVTREVQLGGRNPGVLREVLLELQFLVAKKAEVELFYALAKLYDGQDIFYRAALNIACGTDPKRRDERARSTSADPSAM